jgi:hypothetical protein
MLTEQREARATATTADTGKGTTTTPRLYAPWAYDEIRFGFDGCACGLPVAARRALEYARDVVEMDAELDGLDWASQIQARCDATREQLAARMPMDADERVIAAALEGIE